MFQYVSVEWIRVVLFFVILLGKGFLRKRGGY